MWNGPKRPVIAHADPIIFPRIVWNKFSSGFGGRQTSSLIWSSKPDSALIEVIILSEEILRQQNRMQKWLDDKKHMSNDMMHM